MKSRLLAAAFSLGVSPLLAVHAAQDPKSAARAKAAVNGEKSPAPPPAKIPAQ